MFERDWTLFVKAVCAAALGWWMALDEVVRVLIALQALDIFAGFLVAAYGKELSSDVMWRGLLKKVGALAVVAAAYHLGALSGVNLTPYVAGYFCAHEGLSILENVARLGVPIPQRLRSLLAAMQEEADGGRRQAE